MMAKRKFSPGDKFYSRFWFSNGQTARGTETKSSKHTVAPHSRLGPRKLTGPAYYLKVLTTDGHSGNAQQQAAQILLAHLAHELGKHVRKFEIETRKKYRIPLKNYYTWAGVILDRYLGKVVSDRKAAERIILNHHSEYQRHYKRHEAMIEQLLRSLAESS